ncbi:MAG: FAD-dependent oxidoreductase [Chthoniobacteraceae bacterium]
MNFPAYFQPAPFLSQTVTADLCVYGGTSGGLVAAIEAGRRGLSVVVLEPSPHLGGMTAGGLGMTDIGNKSAIGGLSREFYRRLGKHYGVAEDWRFEPHVAEAVFEEWIAETSTRVFRRQFVDLVIVKDRKITELRTLSGLTVRGKMFIDASYEGDLMKRAGVRYFVGRESNARFGETLNGAQIGPFHQFDAPVDPYVVPGVPSSGVLPGIEPNGAYAEGAGDARIQAYNFRICLTQRPELRIPFPKPADYDPAQYLLLKRYLATGWNEVFHKFDAIRNGKTDTNNHGGVSSDFIGQNYAYPEADYATRDKIFQQHVTYHQGLLWCMANDCEIPAAIREPMSAWGLCRDEFVTTGGWPHALYIRESRRMISDVVMTESHCRWKEVAEDPVGLGAYTMDSHNCRRFVLNGRVWNEGDVQETVQRPYGIPYRSIVPARGQCENLLVTFCLSASHIAFGSIRMEPVLMVLSQSAAIAAAIALENGSSVQDVPYGDLRMELDAAGQILASDNQIVRAPGHAEFIES